MTSMKPKTEFDPMFQADGRRRRGLIRSIGALMVVLTLSGLAVLAAAPPPRARGPVTARQVLTVQPHDQFMIVAPPELDAAMVVRARADLDAEMVVNPEMQRRGSAPIRPAPGPGLSVPKRVPAAARGILRSGQRFP
jgi:hypothetical protein